MIEQNSQIFPTILEGLENEFSNSNQAQYGNNEQKQIYDKINQEY